MPYDDIGTTKNTYPPGDIPSEEQITRNNVNYIVEIYVTFIDDPSDGTISSNPIDPYPYDYKIVEVRIRRASSGVNLAVLTTNIAAKAAETSTNTGILYFCAVDAENQPVSDATLNISNDTLTPVLSMEFLTGVNGCVMVPMLPPDTHNHYHLVVTKDGYSTAMTYPRTAQNPNQLYANIDIIVQQVTRATLAIDKISSITLRALDLSGNPVPDLSVHLSDDYEIYFNPSTMRYSQDHTLDANGTIIINDLAFANYNVSINSTGYYLSSSNPSIPFNLPPDTNKEVVIYVTNSSTAPTISGISPMAGKIVDTMTIMINGANFQSPATLKLINPSSGAEIIASDVEVHAGSQVSGVFDLTLGSIGFWDVYVQNPNNEFARKVGGFEIIN